jgi:DNA polymerase I-like protein with 3'-5' exonuclease and polymerase domains
MTRKLNRRWKPELPDLSRFSKIAIDTETYDPDLLDLGCGCRRDGYMVGLSVAGKEENGDSSSWYVPIRHHSGVNLDPEVVSRWANDQFKNTKQDKVFANCMYDLDYLAEEGVEVKGRILDIQLAEPLIDENAFTYNLERISKRYLGEGKFEDEMNHFVKEKFGLKAKVKENIWRIPSNIVRGYAEIDAVNPLEIFEAQEKIIHEEGLDYIFDIETRLIPMLLRMKRNGVRVNIEKTEELTKQYKEQIKINTLRLYELAGYEMNYNANDSIAIYCDREGIKYNITKKTKKPSFVKDWLKGRDEEIFELILDLRSDFKVSGTFFDGHILRYAVNGRVHGQFNQLRSDDGGTVSGRFSSSKPNLQQLPSPEKALGNIVRQLFLPEEGEEWCSSDLKQIEPRVTLHYSRGNDAEEAKLALWEDLKYFNSMKGTEEFERLKGTEDEIKLMDSYQSIIDSLPQYKRKMLKTVYLGVSYSMGITLLCNRLGLSRKEGSKVIDDFHAAAPYIKALSNRTKAVAEERGYIRTLMGRRRRFNLYEPTNVPWNKRKNYPALPYEDAKREYGSNIARAFCYKSLNSLIQGSSADLLKKMMVDSWEAGIYDVLTPLVSVHDELGMSKPKTKVGDEAVKELENMMSNVWPELTVPISCDVQCASDWGGIS